MIRFFPLTVVHAMVGGVIVRLLAFAVIENPDFPDARSYVTAGQELISTGIMKTHNIYMPLYPLWTAITGPGTTQILADIGLSTATVWLVHRISLAIFVDRRAALMAAFAAAIYPHLVFYAITGLTETAFIFLLCAAFLSGLRGRAVAASIFLVLSILVRPSIDLIAPVLVVLFVAVAHRGSFAVTLAALAKYAIIYVLLMSPWWIHNYAKYGTFVRLNLGDGIVLVSGNNPTNQTGGGVGRDGTLAGLNDMQLGTFSAIEDPIARNEAMKKAAFDFMRENPGRTLELAGLKFLRFWRLWPFAPEFAEWRVIVLSIGSYGVLLAFAIICTIQDLARFWRPMSPILLLTAYLMAVSMVTIASVRYRLPVEPFIVILGTRALATMLSRAPRCLAVLERYT